MSGSLGYNPYGPFSGPAIGGLNGLFGQNLAQNNSISAFGMQQQNPFAGQQLQQAFGSQPFGTQTFAALFGPIAEPEEAPKHEGFVIGEITGHRCWRVQEDELLTSLTADEIWAPDEPMTATKGVAGIEGQGKGDIGIHAFKTQRHALKFAKDWKHGRAIVYGRVHLWGDIVEHEIGYRAENARIVSIDGAFGKRWLNKLRKRYHCNEAQAA